jgi:serine phosphatase RsbU (regulator of sigma subunit)/anti-sigma regulatory factor (Ser/Thr protein kinase)
MSTLPLHAHRTFAADERSVAKARAFAREMLETWDAGDLADSVVLLVSELVTNAVVHAGTTARLELRLDTQSVRVEVEDLHPRRVLPMVVDEPPEEAEDGRGLLITFSLASAWGVDYTSASKRVWLRFDRPVDQVATPRWSPEPGDNGRRAHVAVAELSGEGVVTAWNADATALFGWRAEEVKGRRFDELLDRVPGEHDVDDLPSTATMAHGWQGTYSVMHKSAAPVTVFASHVGRERGPGSTVLMVATTQRALIERPPGRAGNSSHGPESGLLGLLDEALVRLQLDDYLMLAVERVRDRLLADAAYLLMLRDLEDEYEVRAVSGLSATLVGTRLAAGKAGAPDPRNPHLPVVADLRKVDVDLLQGTGLRSMVLVPIAAENRVVGAICVASSHIDGFSTDQSVVLQQIANALAVATDRARLQALERERRGWLTFLAEAGDLLAGSLDQDMTMAITGQIVVPKVASWCAVHLDDERGHPVLHQVWHEDERKVEALRAELEESPAVGAGELDEPHQTQSGEEMMTVPLVARGRRIGHLSLGRPAGDPLRGEPLLVAESVARRAAMAIENARAHGELRAIGNALQRSLLPSSIPEAPGVDVGVVYEAAGEETTAGGDFYDLFPLGAGRSCFVVGDVCGTGPEAAAVTGLARHTIRALVLAGFPICDVLERLNTAIIAEGERSRFLTLLCGILQPVGDAMRVEMVSAGHPLPMIVHDEGEVEQVGRPQSLLGVVDDVRYVEETHRLSRGELFVAVTDGVLERRVGQLMVGEEGLASELSAMGTSLSAQAVAERIRRLVVEFAPTAPRDDMAVLVLRIGEPVLDS